MEGDTLINNAVETLDLTKKDKVYEYTVTFTDRVTMGGAGVSESEEQFRQDLTKRFEGAKEFVIDEIKFIGSVQDVMANMAESVDPDDYEEAKPIIN